MTADRSLNTIPEGDLPWRTRGRGPSEPIPHLVIIWSLDEPERIGEAIPITGPCVIGRGGERDGDPAPRGQVVRQRPGASVPMHPLGGSRISRQQLKIEPRSDGRLDVANLGQVSLAADGVPVDTCIAGPGTTLAIKNAITFLVVARPPVFPALRAAASTGQLPFGRADAHGIVGESAAVWRLRDDLAFVGGSPGHVLVRGPSGVGKELAARALHASSPRRDAAPVTRNAATFPEGLVDAELFGNVKNYPNPGMPERVGLIGEADGTTLFLDEIGELAPHLQAHLLRVLDAGGEYQRLGDSATRRADLRFVAATNRPLEELKHDFAARLSQRIEIPGLDARREDIPLLIRHLLDKAFRAKPELGTQFVDERTGLARTDPQLIDWLVRHQYTHHLRELDRLVWIALSTSRENFLAPTAELEAELDLQAAASIADAETPDRAAVDAALSAANGNISRAARALGLKNRFALYRLMKGYGIAVPQKDDET